ncbi:hypothetical protein M231_07441 [Tremella mesenterica]|uniref:Methylase n=1 Tax=Tremella mesenterica TaxID=5217 RepID=A0A4Q1B9D1_TREME|nr:uncharacterized protein TREMEDRAFT_67251 [Tremella mesenterica DSM 1558]EIW73179.1 hypothetical protein TREMEDRAFT_67251 [Tremella mesenterica DSM 1558]RXK35302.1 hypothetical protein M231_07441 [Tremella mesenterica]
MSLSSKESIPTPIISHLTEEDYEHVYEPAEDTFILLDALEADATFIRERNPTLCGEIGSGSGIVSTFLYHLLGLSTYVLSTDINLYACSTTIRTAKTNSVPSDPILCSLLYPLRDRICDQVDLLIFNPPYVPTDLDELQNTQIEKDIGGSWAGGKAGMEITDIILSSLDEILSPLGIFYLVAVEPNDPPAIIRRMKEKGFESRIVLRRRAGRELLSVLRFTRSV